MSRDTTSSCFFIIGYGRSGTTLFRRMASAHPQLFVPPENDIFRRLPPLLSKGLRNDEDLQKVLSAVPEYYDQVYDLARFRELASQKMPMSLPETLVTFFDVARLGRAKSDAMWGHKMPSDWPYIGTWRDWYPRAKFVHVVRHPLNATASMIKYQLQSYPTTPLIAAWQWRKAFRTMDSHGKELGSERYRRIHYEDLVSNPEEVLDGVCRFLQISPSYVPQMKNYRKYEAEGTHLDQGAHMDRANAPLDVTQAHKSSGLTSEQETLMNFLLREELERLYHPKRKSEAPHWLQRVSGEVACSGLDLAWLGLRTMRRARGQL